jgi:hypothetical protein
MSFGKFLNAWSFGVLVMLLLNAEEALAWRLSEGVPLGLFLA